MKTITKCFGGAFKVAFCGITGHQSAVKDVYSKIKTLDDDLKSLPFGSQQINDRVVTVIWQNNQRAKNIGEDEIDVAKKISAVDGPPPVHVRRPAFADQEIKVTLPQNFFNELVEEKTPSSFLWFRVLN